MIMMMIIIKKVHRHNVEWRDGFPQPSFLLSSTVDEPAHDH